MLFYRRVIQLLRINQTHLPFLTDYRTVPRSSSYKSAAIQPCDLLPSFPYFGALLPPVSHDLHGTSIFSPDKILVLTQICKPRFTRHSVMSLSTRSTSHCSAVVWSDTRSQFSSPRLKSDTSHPKYITEISLPLARLSFSASPGTFCR